MCEYKMSSDISFQIINILFIVLIIKFYDYSDSQKVQNTL
jgi:hypothetical protein